MKKHRKTTAGNRRRRTRNKPAAKGQIRDANSRMIFQNPILVSQFLRDNLNIPALKDVKPEDIEDVTEKYQAYLGITFETDTVKRIRLYGDGTEGQLYLISLIEHKSQVDHNVAFQLLRYMTCIWNEYAREAERKKTGCSKTKEFRYPAILPIVYYEGKGKWTADLHLRDRFMMKEALLEYLPDFTYRVVRLHDYTDEELLGREDEMSLLMMINKIQTAEDMTRFLQGEQEKISEIVSKAPAHILEIIASTIWSLCIKMNLPVKEAEECVKKVKDRNMGYLFENMEKIDIQAERRKVKAERQKAEAERQKAEAERQRAEEAEQQVEKGIKIFIRLCRQFNMSEEKTTVELMEKYELSRVEAVEKVRKYWHE
ncbi:MAG: Rpn family recombination-promoting nuclease/putative transposase [Eubacteriales bacterium]|nr:Rpn family recombination-promoting nuclease/putative transposase [Eubacteriales bacterium]